MLFIGLPARNYTAPSQTLFFDKSTTENTKYGDDYISLWLGSHSRSVMPRFCHSHNDYWRPYPLFSALAAGCSGIEADVWLSDNGKDLLVGHDRESLSPNKTLQSMYLEPLLKLLNHRNPTETWANSTVYDRAQGLFETQPNTTVVLMVDVKEKASVVWPLVVEQLEPLRRNRFLTRHEKVYTSEGFVERQTLWLGPLVVVGSGDLDRASLAASYNANNDKSYHGYHDTFLDAPLEILPHVNTFWAVGDESSAITPPGLLSTSRMLYYPANSYYASVSFKQSIGSVVFFSSSVFNSTNIPHTTAEPLYTLPMPVVCCE